MQGGTDEAKGGRDMIDPPHLKTADGGDRLIGMEIEFSGPECREAAELVRKRFGGTTKELNRYRYEVRETVFGTFSVELDFSVAHKVRPEDYPKWSNLEPSQLPDVLEDQISSALSDITSLWLPVEIVAPPIPIRRLPELDAITQDLRAAGAEGTGQGLLFAFATQLNPEVPALDADSIRRHLQALLLLSDWLRHDIDLDIKRRLLPFIDPFPDSYRRRVVDPAYRPELGQLIDDYLVANPTRNRELDMLPLFLHLDAERVRARVDDPLVKARPTFHYRLPDTRLADPEWGFITEWNRWVRVEQLADDPDRLRQAGEEYLGESTIWNPRTWADAVRRWFE